ncbi:hypothetical protein ACO0K7_16500 [Undibacterium sp. Ji67W]
MQKAVNSYESTAYANSGGIGGLVYSIKALVGIGFFIINLKKYRH